ncbi:ABC transporter ATP-binding protein [Paenibacillus silvae]|uniref:ABC transporter n=1 Tax=Paenibacillus silvae TaxID=1325358 RepID=A0ABQ1ZI67_9BACL|nr:MULTISPECIES: ATP-binding cassette domain-containing protein [Paenibacillus]MCK6077545.1 ATP-binding cassette domain-containing protein [Paenibacillus silvae]MCK6151723.1 ATP-binding cassette domain-containing protein [Paenibacillus silvae]MCK6270209.1 ATP-binding cassette domain-containing protein [Paenibacillus silvae]GGH67745.1 ABC transporter [Paenibacillus silvae]
MSIIHLEGLSKSFKYYEKELGLKKSLKNLVKRKSLIKEAVSEISLVIEQGEMVGFLGPNGSGKTTTLKMLSGILYPTSGQATVLGYVPWERKKEFKMQFSIVMGQKSQLWWDLPANESLYLNKCIYEIEDKPYNLVLDELTEMLDVKDLLNIQVRRLSLGERMKMELIASLIHRPKVIFLDEPTIGLDLISQKRIREFLKDYNEQTKATVILTSHYMADIEDLCKRAIIINQGKIVYDGDLRRVNELLHAKKIIKLQFTDEVPRQALSDYGTITQHDGMNAVMEIDKHDLQRLSKMILDRFPILDFTVEDVPVERGIESLYQKDGVQT